MKRGTPQYRGRRGSGRGHSLDHASTPQPATVAEQKQEEKQIAVKIEKVQSTVTNGVETNDGNTEDHSYNVVEEDVHLDLSEAIARSQQDNCNSDLDGCDMEIIDDIDSQANEEGHIVLDEERYVTEPDTDQCEKELAAPGVSHNPETAVDNSDDDLVETNEDMGANDDLVEFMASLGVKGSTGLMELTVAGVPPIQVVASETRDVRLNRKLVVENVLPSDLCSSVIQGLFESDTGIQVKIEFDKPQIDCPSWHGKLELLFCSAESAANAANQLRMLRDGMLVEQGKVTEDVSRVAAGGEPWVNLILIVKNIGIPSESCKAKLTELFPAADIAFHKDSPTELLKGQAYLVFGSKQQAAEAIHRFKTNRPKLNGRRLILISWNINQILPEGMLKIGERRLVMQTMMNTEADMAKNQGNATRLKDKYSALCDVIAADTKARRACGFPAPSYNQLKGLHDVRVYSDAEQGLILRRLLGPYSSVVASEPPKSVSSVVKEPPVKSPAVVRPGAAKPNMPSKANLSVEKSVIVEKSVVTKPAVPIKAENDANSPSVSKPMNRPNSGPRQPVKPGALKQEKAVVENNQAKNLPLQRTPLLDNSKKRPFETSKPGNIVKKLGYKPSPPVKQKVLPLLNLPMSKSGLLGSPPPVPNEPVKPLFRSTPQRQPASTVKPLLSTLPVHGVNSGRPSARESGSEKSFFRSPPSIGQSSGGGPRTSLLGSHPGDFRDEEPPSKLSRVQNYRFESNELQWANSATRSTNQSRYDDEEREMISLARERLSRTIEDKRMSSLDNKGQSASNWMDKNASVNDFQQVMPGFDRDEQRLNQGWNMNRPEETRSLMGNPPDMARSLMGHPPDRGLISSNESVAFSRNDGLMRQRSDWNQRGLLDDGPGSSYNTRNHMVNSSNEARVGPNSLSASSASPLFARNQWSRVDDHDQEDFHGVDNSSTRWQTGGMSMSESRQQQQRSDSPLQSRQSSDQADTVSLLLNLSQLLADKLQRDREKKRLQH